MGAACFATLSLIIAAVVKTRERFMGIGQVLTMPLFFASNAIYPLAIMPAWVHAVARVNPLSHDVDALRALMIAGGSSTFGLATDYVLLTGTTALLVVIASTCTRESSVDVTATRPSSILDAFFLPTACCRISVK